MKAISILKPIEFSLETKGEAWAQGTKLEGILVLKNQEKIAVPLSDFKLGLGLADIKKVHAKTAGCFKLFDQIDLPKTTLEAGEVLQVPYTFHLDPNLPVTDKKSSFYLLYGKMDSPFHLALMITPQPLFLELIKLVDTFFRFKLKEQKGTNKGVDFIFLPPTSREFATVENMTLSCVLKEQDLVLDFTFNLKKIDMASIAAGASSNKVIKETKTISRTLAPKDYLMGKTHLDQDKLLKMFEVIFTEIKPKHF